jgi:hypothetical protein
MRAQTGQDVRNVWLVTGLIFLSTVIIVKMMDRGPGRVMPALWTGYVGLAAVGGALFFTAAWVHRHGPSSFAARSGIYALIAIATLLWLLALVFPFL